MDKSLIMKEVFVSIYFGYIPYIYIKSNSSHLYFIYMKHGQETSYAIEVVMQKHIDVHSE